MIIQHSFFKNASPIAAESVEKVFGKLEPVSKMEPNRFELPITSIRRILGDKFYNLENGPNDTIRTIICDNGGFKDKELKFNYDKGNELLQFISMLFQGFIDCNHGSEKFTKEFMEKPVAKFCITSNKGLITHDVGLEFLSPVSKFDDNQVIVGMKNMTEIAQITQEVNDLENNINQMKAMNNAKGVDILVGSRDQLANKMVQYQSEIIDAFFDVLKKFNNSDNVEDIYDVAMVVSNTFVDPEGKEKPIVGTTIIDYHDVASRNVVALKNKFHID